MVGWLVLSSLTAEATALSVVTALLSATSTSVVSPVVSSVVAGTATSASEAAGFARFFAFVGAQSGDLGGQNSVGEGGVISGSTVVGGQRSLGGFSVVSGGSVIGLVVGTGVVVAGLFSTRSSIGALSFIVASGKSLTFGSNVVVQAVKAFGLSTIKVEPPITDKVVLVENSSVGAEERVFGKTSLTVSSTDVEHLALSLGISVVSYIRTRLQL